MRLADQIIERGRRRARRWMIAAVSLFVALIVIGFVGLDVAAVPLAFVAAWCATEGRSWQRWADAYGAGYRHGVRDLRANVESEIDARWGR